MTFRLVFAIVLSLGAWLVCWLETKPSPPRQPDERRLWRFVRRIERTYRRLRASQ